MRKHPRAALVFAVLAIALLTDTVDIPGKYVVTAVAAHVNNTQPYDVHGWPTPSAVP